MFTSRRSLHFVSPAALARPRSRGRNECTRSRSACALVVWLAVACSKSNEAPEASPNVAPGNPPTSHQLPIPFELRDDTPDLLLTWIDEQGEFHVVQQITEVPEASREKVRVVLPSKDLGTGQTVYVADLRTKDAAGRYPILGMPRAEWNELGAEKRKVRMEAMAPKAPATSDATANPSGVVAGSVRAVIYGASWCKPCHDAEALLKKLGVDVVKKDIEESRAAQAEMQQRLAQAGRGGASIPVIDVAGQLFVGYEPRQLTAAVEKARAQAGKTSKM